MKNDLNEPQFIEFNYDGVQVCAEYSFQPESAADAAGDKNVTLHIKYTTVTADPIAFKISKPESILDQPQEIISSVIKREIMRLHSDKNVQREDVFY